MTMIPEIREHFNRYLDKYEGVLVKLLQTKNQDKAIKELEKILLDMAGDVLLKYFVIGGRDFSLSVTNNEIEEMFGDQKVLIFGTICNEDTKEEIIDVLAEMGESGIGDIAVEQYFTYD